VKRSWRKTGCSAHRSGLSGYEDRHWSKAIGFFEVVAALAIVMIALANPG
jgi:hypothetical protein